MHIHTITDMKEIIFLLFVWIYSVKSVADDDCSIEPYIVSYEAPYYNIYLYPASDRKAYYKINNNLSVIPSVQLNDVYFFTCNDINVVQNIMINILLDSAYFTKIRLLASYLST